MKKINQLTLAAGTLTSVLCSACHHNDANPTAMQATEVICAGKEKNDTLRNRLLAVIGTRERLLKDILFKDILLNNILQVAQQDLLVTENDITTLINTWIKTMQEAFIASQRLDNVKRNYKKLSKLDLDLNNEETFLEKMEEENNILNNTLALYKSQKNVINLKKIIDLLDLQTELYKGVIEVHQKYIAIYIENNSNNSNNNNSNNSKIALSDMPQRAFRELNVLANTLTDRIHSNWNSDAIYMKTDSKIALSDMPQNALRELIAVSNKLKEYIQNEEDQHSHPIYTNSRHPIYMELDRKPSAWVNTDAHTITILCQGTDWDNFKKKPFSLVENLIAICSNNSHGYQQVLETAFEDIWQNICSQAGFKNKPVILFGHSMGGIAIEFIARKLAKKGMIIQSVYSIAKPLLNNPIEQTEQLKQTKQHFTILNDADEVLRLVSQSSDVQVKPSLSTTVTFTTATEYSQPLIKDLGKGFKVFQGGIDLINTFCPNPACDFISDMNETIGGKNNLVESHALSTYIKAFEAVLTQ